MTNELLTDIDVSPDVLAWAKNYDSEYLKHRAKFAPEPVRSIAKLVLAIQGEEALK